MAEQRLGIAFPLGVSVSKWTRIFAERHPAVLLDVVRAAAPEQPGLLADGSADFCFARLPFAHGEGEDARQRHVIPLYEENVVAVMHDEHLLTLEKTLTRDELTNETVLDGEPDERMLRDVAEGRGIAVIPQSVAKALRRKDVSALPITDAEPVGVALVWLRDNPNPFLDEFVGIVRGRTPNSSRGRLPEQPADPAAAPTAKKPARPSSQRKSAASGKRRGQRR